MKTTIQISIFPHSLGINDLGSNMNSQFKNLFQDFFETGKANLTYPFIEESKKLFDSFDKNRLLNLSDRYFENFTIITENLIKRKQFYNVFVLWNRIVDFVKEWEETSNKKLHKGTPHYFSAAAAISSYNFDAAFMLMHSALEEDKRNRKNYKDYPAYLFLTLNDDNPAQYLKQYVDGMVNFLRRRLDSADKGSYLNSRGGILTYKDLKNKFLENDTIPKEMKYYFVYSIIRIWHLRKLHKTKIGDNVMAPIIFTQSLGGLLIIIEQFIKNKYPHPVPRNNFGNSFKDLARNEGWDQNLNLRTINNERDAYFDNWVDQCLHEDSILGDYKLAYGLRNFTFHKIESQKKLWKIYTYVLQAILNSLFESIRIQ